MQVSIITINYNNGAMLESTVKSVIDNKRNLDGEAEYIVIDGGSTDNSVPVIQEYAGYIDYWVSEKDKGVYNAMNKGVSIAKGSYCLFLNSGDTFYEKDTLRKVLHSLDTDFVCGNACLKYADGVAEWKAPQIVDMQFFLRRFSVCHQSLFIRTSLLKARPYNESLAIVGDYEQLFYEMVVNHRSYKRVELTICYYGCDGISSCHEKSDAEKRYVLNEFRHRGYIEPDELCDIVNRLKAGTRKYRLLLFLAKCIVNNRMHLWK
ncbi:glycosyltransferase family 2 protein [Bacteroides congonensis]